MKAEITLVLWLITIIFVATVLLCLMWGMVVGSILLRKVKAGRQGKHL